ncbi:MAG: hypothetical protein A3B70_08275 [Deltaproteobacteria bacterium RIFCSPHIGHO2_02_FULL_40_11]|nr:MAG: hypothetical protein A3B70_08275 [Deltaproteobacteria bacterium RIFCSPHIGHO2_02_FULL_40_11]
MFKKSDGINIAHDDSSSLEASRRPVWLGRAAQTGREGQAAPRRWSGATAGSKEDVSSCAMEIPIISLIGRISPIKGHKDFIQALSHLKANGFPFQAWIIGKVESESYLGELKSLTQDLQLENHITFKPHQEDIEKVLQKIDILVAPSTYPESFGRVIIEAQACWVPVIATRLGGFQEIIEHEKTGLLVPPHTPLELANAMARLLKDANLKTTLQKNGRKFVEDHFRNEGMFEKTLQCYKNVSKILIIKLSSWGDLVLISPSLRALRKEFPKAKITLLTDPRFKSMMENCPYIDEIWMLPKQKLKLTLWQFSRKIKKEHFDLSFDFQNTKWTHLLAYFGKVKKRLGYERNFGKQLLTHAAPERPLPPVEHQFQVLKQIGISPKDDTLEVFVESSPARDDIHYIVINLGGSWETKKWPSAYIAQTVIGLIQEGYDIVFTGDKNDLAKEKEVLDFIQHNAPLPMNKIHSLVGKTDFETLCNVIQNAAVVMTSDSLPLHLAAAYQKPTVALFGPTHAKFHAPPAKNLKILQEKTECGPCYKPSCKHHSCMLQIKPNQVLSAITYVQKQVST